MSNQITVPFHGSNLFIVNFNNEPYTPMKPIVEGMGLVWGAQAVKIKQRFSSTVSEIDIVANDGKLRKMACLPLRKLAGWLQSISPNKVRAEIRDNVIQYQNECDDVLYEYWTTGEVKNKAKTTTDERTPLRDAVNLLVGKKGIMYPEAYSFIHQRFNVSHVDELAPELLPDAIEYVHRLALEGEFIPKDREPLQIEVDCYNVNALTNHLNTIVNIFSEQLEPALRSIESPLAGRLVDRIHNSFRYANQLKISLNSQLPRGATPRVY